MNPSLNSHEDGIVNVEFFLFKRLFPDERDSEVDVDGQGDDLCVDQGHPDLPVRGDVPEPGPEFRQPGHEGGVTRSGGDEIILEGGDQELSAPLEREPPVGVQDVVTVLRSYQRRFVLINKACGHQSLDGGEPLAEAGGDSPQTEDVGDEAVPDNCSSDQPGLTRRYYSYQC